MKITERLVEHCHNLTYDALPKEVQTQSKLFFIDELGLIIRGQHMDSTKTILKFARKLGCQETAPVTGTKETLPTQYAALVNGAACHSLELDDVGNEASAHPGTTLFPALLPLSYEHPASGKEFLAAIVAGYDVVVKIGAVLTPTAMYKKAHHPTTLCGNFGVAVAAAKYLGLNRQQMLYAIGLAGSTTGGSMEYLGEGTPSKRFQVGMAAHNGILCAKLAQEGFVGPSAILEGKNGAFHAFSDNPDLAHITGAFGQPFEIMKTAVKPHACCGYALGCIDSVLEIVKKHNLQLQDIQKITVGLNSVGYPILAIPVAEKTRPQTVVAAQFSMQYAAAMAVLKRRALLDEYDEQYLNHPDVLKLMSKVECVKDTELDKLWPKQWPAWAKIITTSGQEYSAKVSAAKGDPLNPLSQEEMIDKFLSVTAPVLKQGAGLKIVKAILEIDQVDNLHGLHQLIQDSLL